MLTADTERGEAIIAVDVTLDDGPFYCPECRDPVILKQGRVKIAHFAHYSGSNCDYSSVGEGEEHRAAKIEIYQSILGIEGISKLRLERRLGEVRADVSFCLHGNQYIAIEIQMSSISPDEIKRRTIAYSAKNIAVLWLVPLYEQLYDDRYNPYDWERYLHTLYYGKVFYWNEGQDIQPVKFEEYFLSGYKYEKRSKRYVTAAFLEPTRITDLTSLWRNEWGDYPRAKLWTLPYMPKQLNAEETS